MADEPEADETGPMKLGGHGDFGGRTRGQDQGAGLPSRKRAKLAPPRAIIAHQALPDLKRCASLLTLRCGADKQAPTGPCSDNIVPIKAADAFPIVSK
ncbi:hypothetical protein DEA98_27465 [Brucella pseudogrignonensis]|nr:hypothetical protein [Brucella pseudogrignonensis]